MYWLYFRPVFAPSDPPQCCSKALSSTGSAVSVSVPMPGSVGTAGAAGSAVAAGCGVGLAASAAAGGGVGPCGMVVGRPAAAAAAPVTAALEAVMAPRSPMSSSLW